MNSIFIIGNGFDLAHGLPTSYNNFIDDFWMNLKDDFELEEIKKIVFINNMYSRFLNYNPIHKYEDIISEIVQYSEEYNYMYDREKHECYTDNSRFHPIFRFENNFFKKVCIHKSIHNWVDVENLYYSELKRIVKSKSLDVSKTDEEYLIIKKKIVEQLNVEFEQIKKLLKRYLKIKVIDKYNFNDLSISKYWKDYYDILTPISVFKNKEKQIYEEFTSLEDKEEIENLFHDQKEGSSFNESYFLCFNYTPTIEMYHSKIRESMLGIKMNYIHNRLQEEEDSVVFGFGDEMDEDYKLIENIDDNEYLKNFKSFSYSQNSNYNNLLDFIGVNTFQLCILGHSCGLSDRVLLNTIFEHENCRSIKIYYHKSGDKDNYTDLVQNISRHFKDKPLMRKRIVNKTLCKPLIQVQIPKIE